MQSRFDVLIVGTGPAGAAAANYLAEAAGLSVAMVDKARLPRFKPCGGIFPKRMAERIGGLDGLGVEREYDSMVFSRRGADVVKQAGDTIGVNRSRFDEAFARRALERADGRIVLIEQFEVKAVTVSETQATIASRDGRQLHGAVLIAADGAFSTIARLTGLNAGGTVRPALDLEIAVPDAVMAQFGDAIHLDLFEVDDGYGWIFPKRDCLSCGVLAWSGKANLNDAVGQYLQKRLGTEFEVIKRKGHGLPIYTGDRQVARGRIMLAGDAANLVEPIYGAGIEAAVESGFAAGKAARAICVEGAAPDKAAKAYEELVHRTIGAPIAAVHRHVSPMFRKKPEFYYRNFVAGGVDHTMFARKFAGLG